MKQHFLSLQILLAFASLQQTSANYLESLGSPGSPVTATNLKTEYGGEDLYDEPDYSSDPGEGSGEFSEEEGRVEGRSFVQQSECEMVYEVVSLVKQVPSFSKHCHRLEDTRCKTVFKNSFQTQIETQCVASFDTR